MNIPKLTVRLQTLNKIMGSRSTNIAELNNCAEGCLERELPDFSTCTDEEFEAVAKDLRMYWPAYYKFCNENARNQL